MKVYLHFEGGSKPAITNKVTIADDDTRTINDLVHLLKTKYSKKYPDESKCLQTLKCLGGDARRPLDGDSLAVRVLSDGQDLFFEEVESVLKCQRMGCDATFKHSLNPQGGCQFHPGPPVFHDGKKVWDCCQQESYDFSLFMEIPGCAIGCHSSDPPPKPEGAEPANSADTLLPTQINKEETPKVSKEDCSRCKQGFFCADHEASSTAPADATESKSTPAVVVAPSPSVPVDPDLEQICRNKGCGNKFTERENGDKACNYHPGPPIFHERKKGWKCCDKRSYDFDEFLSFPPCTWGRHNSTET